MRRLRRKNDEKNNRKRKLTEEKILLCEEKAQNNFCLKKVFGYWLGLLLLRQQFLNKIHA